MDAYTVALLHMTGADASTTFRDESGKTWTANGNTQMDTAITSPLTNGGSTALFDGTGDYLETVDHADWRLDDGSNSNKWTIDAWIRFNGDPGTGVMGIVQQYVDTNNFWGMQFNNNFFEFQIRSGGSNIVIIDNAWNPAGSQWYHVACVKNGTTGYLTFVDGTQVGSTTTDTDPMPDFAGVLRVGRYTNGAGADNYLNGWVEELRISKGIARYTGNFTPQKLEYSSSNGFFF